MSDPRPPLPRRIRVECYVAKAVIADAIALLRALPEAREGE